MRDRWKRWSARGAWGAALVAGLAFFALRTPTLGGDALEYLACTQALADHATPDVRSDDLARLSGELRADGVAPGAAVKSVATLGSARGPTLTIHFWLYPLATLPAYGLLRLLRGDVLAASQVTNFAAAWLALALAVRWGRARRQGLAWLLALSVVSPVLWYLPWPSTEAFMWALVVISLAAWRTGRLGRAAFAAALASCQNTMAGCFAVLAVGTALWRRDRRATTRAAAGAAVAAIAPAFNLYYFGDPSVIHLVGSVDTRLVGAGRVASVLFDLSQGMLPYVPGLLALVAWALVRRRAPAAYACAAAGLGVVFMCGVMNNWNAGETGMMRYAVWVVPAFACAVAEAPPAGRRGAWTLGAVVALQAGILLSGSSHVSYVDHGPLARLALDHAPWLYDPDPEIFAERTLHLDGWKGELPVVYARPDGRVTKVLTDWTALTWLFARWEVDPAYRARMIEEHEGEEGAFYLDPPAGAVRPTDPGGS